MPRKPSPPKAAPVVEADLPPLAHPQELNGEKRIIENVPITQGTRQDLGDGFVVISY